MTRPPAVPRRVGVDGRALEPPRTGVGRYVWELCRRLDRIAPSDVEFHVYARAPVELPGERGRWLGRWEPRPRLRALPGVAWLKTRGAALARRDRLDVFWASATLAPPLAAGTALVSTVYDLNVAVAGETMPTSTRLAHRLFFRRDLARADRVVAISQGTADRLQRHYGVGTDAVIRPAVASSFRVPGEDAVRETRARYGIERPYFLAVATWEPRKNLDVLLHAFDDVADELPGHELVLVGGRGWKDEALARGVALRSGVRAVGYVPDDDLPALYRGATAFLFPSRYEGFGLPVLEARACGAVVVASDLPEIREAGGDGTTYVRPTRDALARAMREASRGALARPPAAAAVPGWDVAAEAMWRELALAVRQLPR